MKLSALLRGAPGVEVDALDGATEIEIAEVREDSRHVGTGDLFVAMRGEHVDGHDYLSRAIAAGAAAVVIDRARRAELASQLAGITVVTSEDPRVALACIAANRYGRPADSLTLLGLTGTNGKTTTNFLIEAILRAHQIATGLLGTVLYRFGDTTLPAPFTTPTPLELHATLAKMRDAGCTHVTMECSSHALALARLHGLSFLVAGFTNLTQDHLDFHGDMAAYRDAKARLFSHHLRSDGVAVILRSKGGAAKAMEEAAMGHRILSLTAGDGEADVRATRVEYSIRGITAELATPQGPMRLVSPLIGSFNLENLLVAVGFGLALSIPKETILAALSTVAGVPGRLERVTNAKSLEIFVDYAHSPDALERAIAALRPLVRGRLIVVFGCGGDRDRAKRPLMGIVAVRDADLAIVTSDNPRTEAPSEIIDMIVGGMKTVRTQNPYKVELDRRAAIVLAVSEYKAGDVILIAGKGHEDYQIVGKTKHHFDDREEAASAAQKLAFETPPRQS